MNRSAPRRSMLCILADKREQVVEVSDADWQLVSGRRVPTRLRDRGQPDHGRQRAELARVERELLNCVDSIAKLGGSPALLSKVRELQTTKARVLKAMGVEATPPAIVPNVEALIRKRIQAVEKIPRDKLADDAMRETARAAVRGLLGGDVTVTEEGDAVFAEVDLGRVYIANGAGRGT